MFQLEKLLVSAKSTLNFNESLICDIILEIQRTIRRKKFCFKFPAKSAVQNSSKQRRKILKKTNIFNIFIVQLAIMQVKRCSNREVGLD
jgi:hypothetical protein